METHFLEQQFGSIRDVHLGDLRTVPADGAVELLFFEIGNSHETADVAHMYSERIGRILITNVSAAAEYAQTSFTYRTSFPSKIQRYHAKSCSLSVILLTT